MATTHTNLSTSLQLGFATGVDVAGDDVITLKTFTRINPEADDEAVRGAAEDLSALYQKAPSLIYRVDSYALHAA